MKTTERGFGLAGSLGAIDRLGIGFDFVVVALTYLLENVAHLVNPAALMQNAGIHGLDGGSQAGTAIGDDQQQAIAHQPASIQILQQSFPGGLAFSLTA